MRVNIDYGFGREIVFDTESTGLDPESGHRVIEIGCVEIKNLVATGRTYHVVIDPERDIPEEASRIHGIKDEHVRGKPLFGHCVADFLEFIADARLIAHNAGFDMKFINHELRRAGHEPLPAARAIDTLQIARRMFPGAPASLDALCRRYEVDNSAREFHGALLDAQLLAEVYLELCGGRQPGLAMTVAAQDETAAVLNTLMRAYRAPRALPGCTVAELELAAHAAFVADLKDALWALLDEADSKAA